MFFFPDTGNNLVESNDLNLESEWNFIKNLLFKDNCLINIPVVIVLLSTSPVNNIFRMQLTAFEILMGIISDDRDDVEFNAEDIT